MSWPNGNTFGPRYDVIHPISKKNLLKFLTEVGDGVKKLLIALWIIKTAIFI